jgi:hypothetical protein
MHGRMQGKTKNIKIVVACTKDIRTAVKFSSENNLVYRNLDNINQFSL